MELKKQQQQQQQQHLNIKRPKLSKKHAIKYLQFGARAVTVTVTTAVSVATGGSARDVTHFITSIIQSFIQV